MTDQEIYALFNPLYADISQDDQFQVKKPLLAHYTSIPVLEAILKNSEVWFSNPLFMNDMEEVQFGILEGINRFLTSGEIEDACGAKLRFEKMKAACSHFNDVFSNDHVLDTYVFCLSEHDKED
jgi:hypothetical protein